MVRIAIVEDEDLYVEQLRQYLNQYQEENGEVFEIMVFSDGDQIVENYRGDFDIIFLDVQMPFMDGMTAAEHIRKLDENVVLIFITNMAQYAIRGYSVNALDFILKPITYFPFSQKLKRTLEVLKKREKKYVTLKVDGGVAKLALNQIYYVESMKHRVIVHGESSEYSLVGTMKDMEERLLGENFFRCNNCYLVNLTQVERVIGTEVIVGGQSLQISRPKRKAFMAALTNYMGGIAT